MQDEARVAAAVDSGFPPIAGNDPVVLVLGSLPGKKSIAEQQYYAHPRNVFWKIMGALFEARTELPYEERVNVLKENRIALWDVLHSSLRPGSLDSSIRMQSVKCNDFDAFLKCHTGVASICFNGKKAAGIFARLAAEAVLRQYPHLQLITLPSTSPAHAAMPFAEKLSRWSVVKTIVECEEN
jgi:hypoxanthine-DNA glycosylase